MLGIGIPESARHLLRMPCAGDAELRQSVEALLASDRDMGDFLDVPVLNLASAAPGEHARSPEGRRIGPYRILREIGRGGMGTVYLAERADGLYRKRVAIKLIKPELGSRGHAAAFSQGTSGCGNSGPTPISPGFWMGAFPEDGLPYLVMECVEGERIDSWCDNRKLPVRDRLKLFRRRVRGRAIRARPARDSSRPQAWQYPGDGRWDTQTAGFWDRQRC